MGKIPYSRGSRHVMPAGVPLGGQAETRFAILQVAVADKARFKMRLSFKGQGERPPPIMSIGEEARHADGL